MLSAERCVVRLREAPARVSVAEWAGNEVTTRGATHCIARAPWTLDGATADLAVWDGRAA